MCVCQDLLCTVNVQHNCVEQHCQASGSQPIYQERQLTKNTRPIITHVRVPNDLVLNTAQMRDAIYVQQFHIASENLDLDEIVHQSAVKELATLKALDTTGPRTGAGKCSASKAADGVIGLQVSAGNMSTSGRPHPCPRQISHLIATA